MGCHRGPSTLGVARTRLRMVLVATHPHVAARHDRRDGMLVDHLAHLIAQQDHELVERLDRALQLDTVHQIDGDRQEAPDVTTSAFPGIAREPCPLPATDPPGPDRTYVRPARSAAR